MIMRNIGAWIRDADYDRVPARRSVFDVRRRVWGEEIVDCGFARGGRRGACPETGSVLPSWSLLLFHFWGPSGSSRFVSWDSAFHVWFCKEERLINWGFDRIQARLQVQGARFQLCACQEGGCGCYAQDSGRGECSQDLTARP